MDANTEALLPCPFCGDEMMNHHGTIMHIKRDDCIIGIHGYIAEWAYRWNTRALSSPEGKAEAVGYLAAEDVNRLANGPFELAASIYVKADSHWDIPVYATPPRADLEAEIERLRERAASLVGAYDSPSWWMHEEAADAVTCGEAWMREARDLLAALATKRSDADG